MTDKITVAYDVLEKYRDHNELTSDQQRTLREAHYVLQVVENTIETEEEE
jgi:hypothetical protein